MTQEALAERLGITFQQLQKYEKGINRISASRLHHAAKVLGVPVSFFFPQEAEPPAQSGFSVPLATVEFLGTPEGIELNRAFLQIADPAVRQRVLDLVQSLVRSSGPAQRGERSHRAKTGKKTGGGASSAPPRRRVRSSDR